MPYPQIMPSSEMHFFDTSQSHVLNGGSGINAKFPDPSNFFTEDPDTGRTPEQESGILKTYGPDLVPIEKSGIFHYDNLQGRFSNAPASRENSITDFTIFNHYIHHYRTQTANEETDRDASISIPFISTYTISVGFPNPYPF